MSGILNKKQRIMDFSLTRNGYEQTQNGDLRVKYVTFTDKDAIYDIAENTIDIADIDSSPFKFEVFNTYIDEINPEFDLKSYIYDSDISNNIRISTDFNNSIVNIVNGKLKLDNINSNDIDQIFSSVAQKLGEGLQKNSILLTNNFFNDSISLKITKINDEELTGYDATNVIDNVFSLNMNSQDITNFSNNDYFTMSHEDIKIKNKMLFEDGRFSKKISYSFLPPENMNNKAITKNNSLQNFYNFSEDKKVQKNIVYKHFNIPQIASTETREIIDNSDENVDNIILKSIKNLENFSKKADTEGNSFQNRINSIEISFDQIEIDNPYIFQFYEKNLAENKINKLVCIDHGEIFDNEKNKYVSVFLLGKLFHSKEEFDIYDELNNNTAIDSYINIDNYIFVNLFTMVVE